MSTKVRKIAVYVISRNYPYYHRGLLELIPGEVLNEIVTPENAFKLSEKFDALRFEKEKELEKIVGGKKLDATINCEFGTLPPELENKRKEIKFLFNVGATILHW